MIVNEDSSIVSKRSFKLSDDPRVVIYDRHRFIKQATGLSSESKLGRLFFVVILIFETDTVFFSKSRNICCDAGDDVVVDFNVVGRWKAEQLSASQSFLFLFLSRHFSVSTQLSISTFVWCQWYKKNFLHQWCRGPIS